MEPTGKYIFFQLSSIPRWTGKCLLESGHLFYQGILEESNTETLERFPNQEAQWTLPGQLCWLPQPRAGLAISPDKNLQTGTRAPISRDYPWTGCSLPQAGSEPLAGQSTNQRCPGWLSRHPLTARKKNAQAETQLWHPKGPGYLSLSLSASSRLPLGKVMKKDTLSLHTSGEIAWKLHDLSGKQLGNVYRES